MDIRDHERSLLVGNSLQNVQDNSIAITGMHNGRIICCGGVIPMNNGNAEIWLLPSIWVSSVRFTFVKELRKWLFGVRQDLALNRMQTTCLSDDLHNRWMSFLGFEKEGVMRKYHNGVDYSIWGRVWE